MAVVREKIIPFLKFHHCFILILVIAAILRLWWVLEFNTFPISDYRGYYDAAICISEGKAYTVNSFEYRSAFWPVGWPFFLSLIFRVFTPSIILAKLVGIGCYLGAMVIAYSLVLRATKSRIPACFTASLLAIYPNHVAYSTAIASENLYILLVLGAIWLYLALPERTEREISVRLFRIGLILGASALVRAHSLLAPILLVAVTPGMWLRMEGNVPVWPTLKAGCTRAARWIAIMYAGLILILSPWIVRNYIVFGRIVLVSTNGGYNLLLGTNPERGLDWRGLMKKYPLIFKGNYNEAERDALAKKQAIKNIRDNPRLFLSLSRMKLIDCFMHDHDGLWYSQQALRGQPNWSLHRLSVTKDVFLNRLIGLNLKYYCLLSVMGICGSLCAVVSSKQNIRQLGIVCIGFAIFFTFFVFLFIAQIRFHYSIMILAALMAGVLVHDVIVLLLGQRE